MKTKILLTLMCLFWQALAWGQIFTKIKDIYPNDLAHSILINGILYFSADDGKSGAELWKTDKTEKGTQLVSDLSPSLGSFPSNFYNFKNNLYLLGGSRCSESNYCKEKFLFKSNGTSGGTIKLSNTIFTSIEYIEYLDKLYFIANGQELWITDGSSIGTKKILQFNGYVRGWTICKGLLFFYSNVYITTYLYRSDGTASGTKIIKEFTGSQNLGSQLASTKSAVFFNAYDTQLGNVLWKSDGEEAGTLVVKDSFGKAINGTDFIGIGNRVFFLTQASSFDYSIWVTDGTPKETKRALQRDSLQNDVRFMKPIVSKNGITYVSTNYGLAAIDTIHYQMRELYGGGFFVSEFYQGQEDFVLPLYALLNQTYTK